MSNQFQVGPVPILKSRTGSLGLGTELTGLLQSSSWMSQKNRHYGGVGWVAYVQCRGGRKLRRHWDRRESPENLQEENSLPILLRLLADHCRCSSNLGQEVVTRWGGSQCKLDGSEAARRWKSLGRTPRKQQQACWSWLIKDQWGISETAKFVGDVRMLILNCDGVCWMKLRCWRDQGHVATAAKKNQHERERESWRMGLGFALFTFVKEAWVSEGC